MLFGSIFILERITAGTVNNNLFNIFLSIGLGLILLLISKVTNGQIGNGDALLFIVTGIKLTLYENILLFAGGIFACGIFSVFILAAGTVKGHNNRNFTLPFVPFLLPVAVWMVIFR